MYAATVPSIGDLPGKDHRITDIIRLVYYTNKDTN
jgi:hypothetical protein